MGWLPEMPPVQKHTRIHTHTQIPGLASAQCWDYRIRTLFHYLPTLYSAHTHTHTMPHCLGQSGRTVSITTHDIYTQRNTVTVCPLGAGKKTPLFIILLYTMPLFVGLSCDLSLCWSVLGQDTESLQTLERLFFFPLIRKSREKKNFSSTQMQQIIPQGQDTEKQRKTECKDTQLWIDITRTVIFSLK